MKMLLAILVSAHAAVSCSGMEFSVRVGGSDVPVVMHRVRGRLNCAYAHFIATADTTPVEVRVAEDIRDWSLSPKSFGIKATPEGKVIRFTLDSPRYLVLWVNEVRLLLLCDPPEPVPDTQRGKRTTIDVTQAPYGVDTSGARDATAGIQRALDKAGQIGNGTVVLLPPGRYTTTGLLVRSHTQLHLPVGCILQGSARAEDYAEFPGEAGRVGISALLRVKDAEGVRILGHGTVDARGFSLAGKAVKIEDVRLKARCLTIENSKRVSIEGLLCRESTSWTVPFFHCTDVSVRRVKVVNDLGPLKHSDGINLCAVRNGLVEDCFVHTTDDAFCAKGHQGAPTENLVFRRLVALSATRGLKCGMQAYETMRNVLFEDVDIVETRDGIDLMHWNGSGEWSNISFRDIRVERCSRHSIAATVREGGRIRKVCFERIAFEERRPGFLRGKDAENRIEDVVIRGLLMEGKPITSLESSGIKLNDYVDGIRFHR